MQAVLYGPNGLALSPQTPAIVDPTFDAMRASIRPLEYQYPGAILGHYRIVVATSAIQFNASANVFALRWAPAAPYSAAFMVPMRFRASFAVATSGGTPAVQRVDALLLFVARQYTVNETTNLSAVTMGGHNQKLRTSMGTSLVLAANVGAATAAAGISGGTKSLDANAIGHMDLSGPGALGGAAPLGFGALTGEMYNWTTLGAHPVVLAANEGLVAQWGATAYTTTTATAVITFELDWAEVLAF